MNRLPTTIKNLPEAYRSDDAYAVSYEVDPDSAVILEDILFAQGSTDFADAYSYDLVGDLAESMNTSEIANERFVIEGHASAEGDYNANLQLSQERAERIARDLVAMGVAPERVVPVGYGEAEARYPDTSPEEERGLDRRVMGLPSERVIPSSTNASRVSLPR
jgi:outer membrane protein OmpA-like peptidoglycan-associated protein